MYTQYIYKNSLAHHGIQGQRWGVRRFQNPDGTLTPEGKARYNKNLTLAKQHIDDAQYLRGELKKYEQGGKDLKENGYWSDHYLELCTVGYNTLVKEYGLSDISDEEAFELMDTISNMPLDSFMKLNEKAIKQIKDEIKISENSARDLLKENERLTGKRKDVPEPKDYTKVYKETGVDMNSEDPDDYRDAEERYYKKKSKN